MNYLAHLYFADNTQLSLLGNLMGDFVKGKSYNSFHPEIVKGIKLHRLIDKYTDSHLIVRQSKNRISNERRRFSGVLIDIFYDHFLAKNWTKFSDTDFFNHVHDWYKKLNSDIDCEIPENMKRITKIMHEEDWLSSYKTVGGIGSVLNRISLRVRFQNNLTGGEEELLANYQYLEDDFYEFFPQLKHYVNNMGLSESLKPKRHENSTTCCY